MEHLVNEVEALVRAANRYDVADLRARLDALLAQLRKTSPGRACWGFRRWWTHASRVGTALICG